MKLLQLIVLIDLQARVALKSEAAKLYLSYLWWALEPLFFVGIYWGIFGFLLKRGIPDYMFFLMCGKVPYLWLQKTVTVAADSLLKNRGLIASIDMPKVVFPYITIQELLYKQCIAFLMLFVIALCYRHFPSLHWLWLMPIVITNYVLIVALSLICTILVTYVQDFKIIINMGMILLIFASGIFWNIADVADPFWRHLLLSVNPLAFLIDAYRRVLMYDQPFDMIHLLAIFAVCSAVIALMHVVFRQINQKLAQQVLQS